MPRRELSKALIPCSQSLQDEFRKTYNSPKGFFYSNELGELFCVVSKSDRSPAILKVGVFKAKGKSLERVYRGQIFLGKNEAVASLSLLGTLENASYKPPPQAETGRQVFRTVIEEAFRHGAKRVKIVPFNERLEKYYRRKFGFRRISRIDGTENTTMQLTKRAKKTPKPRVH